MKKVFDSTTVKQLNLKNRFFRSATWEGLADQNGHLTKDLSKVYEDLAKGGVGVIITGHANVLESDQPIQNMMGIYDDTFIEEYKQMTDRVHEYGTAVIMQIVHGGSNTTFKVNERKIIAPSAVENLAMKTMPQEMTKTEIQEVIKAFADAAARVKRAGFDGVQLHVAHGFLLNQFLTPYYNRRTDEYGGSIENRARIIAQTYQAVRKAVGEDYPVIVKINCDDFMDNGLSLADSIYVSKLLSDLKVDLIEVSGGCYSSREGEGAARIANRPEQESYFKDYAAKIAEQVKVPVALVGGNRSLETMSQILNNTKIEYFSLSRPLLREPNLVSRWAKGNTEKAKCVSCNQCFVNPKTCIFNS
ncbi:MAG: dehydrogenase [Sporomusa sp.]|nr:dehydrogenase [Sporomusa sp.]